MASLHKPPFFFMWRGPLFKLLPPSWLFPEKREAVAPHLFLQFSLQKRKVIIQSKRFYGVLERKKTWSFDEAMPFYVTHYCCYCNNLNI